MRKRKNLLALIGTIELLADTKQATQEDLKYEQT